MKRFSWILVLILFSFPKFCLSQDSLVTELQTRVVPSSVVKFSPFHLVNFYPSVQAAYEQRITPRSSLQIDLGYVFNNNLYSDDFMDKRGIKVKLEYRHYLPQFSFGRTLVYVSAEPYLNAVNFDRLETIVQCFDLDCNNRFSRRIKYLVQYREHGLSIKAGMVFRIGPNFIFDVNSGLMRRVVDYIEVGRPDGIPDQNLRELFPIPNERKRTALGPVLGLRIGYIIRK